MADVKSFRWRGPGVLHIKGRPDGRLVVVPPYEPGVIEHGCIVKDPLNIQALGQERIASLIKSGQAEVINWTDGVAAFLRPDATAAESMTVADAKASEDALQGTATFEQFVADQNAELGKNMSPADKAAAEAELRKMGSGATARVVTSGSIAGGPKAGPDRS